MPSIDVKEEYTSRLNVLARVETGRKRLDQLLAAAKLLVALAAVVMILWLAKYHSARIAYALVPIVMLAALFVWHERVLLSLRR
ncbi:MAG TPA: hypothetical protein VMA71_09040, partial [Alloacidobacterium sp.]|nr:hypothetical protein [Alloacidobacterium sp.]